MKRTNAALALVIGITGLGLSSGPAQALPSISIIWRSSGTATLVSPAASSDVVADIVLTTDAEVIRGVFISIEFDATELQAVSAQELATINLPGMGNEFRPISPSTLIDNGIGQVTDFDEATLSTGLGGGNTVTLGSVTFRVASTTGGATDIDVIASLHKIGTDAIVGGGDGALIDANFIGASVVPEPTTTMLVVAGIAGLAYAGRKSSS